jgi:hypothetical protein
MHGGNQINEKLLMMLLIEVWEACQTAQDWQDLIRKAEDFINTIVLETQTELSGSCLYQRIPNWKQLVSWLSVGKGY